MKVNRRFGGHMVSIFRLEELAKQETRAKQQAEPFHREDASDMTLRNVG
jgi:hypothetical protein